jgi:uncharacterized cupredoxin-like copper-binding protein
MKKTGALIATLGVGLILGLFLVSGCSIDGSKQAAAEATARVTERDFRISAPGRLPAGQVKLAVTNRGPDAHELILVRETGRHLTLRPDGLTVNEDKIENQEAGGLEPADPTTRDLTVDLKPGAYVMLCNMSGHYMAGMRHRCVVR